MSIEIMSAIWPVQFPEKSQKWVLMVLADAADPVEGITWLPIESERGKLDICLKSQLSPRTVQRALRALESDGWIDRFENPGKGVIYRVHKSPIARKSGGDMVTPYRGDMVTPPRGDMVTGGGVMVTPKTLIKHQLKKEGPPTGTAVDNLDPKRPLPRSLEAWQWEAYIDVRHFIEKPLNGTVATLLLNKLDKIEAEGWHIGDVVERAIVNGWTDFLLPTAGRSAGLRRLIDGQLVAGPGVTKEDMAAAAEIDALESMNDRLTARAEFFAASERRNEATALGDLVGKLPILGRGSNGRTFT